jgi:hypothetical protein
VIPIPAVPIPSAPLPAPPPAYIGAPASAHPVRGVPRTPQNPHMAPNGKSGIHNDGWQTNAFTWGGPLGRSPQQLSAMIVRDCGSITFDQQGRVVSVCVGIAGPQLYMFDPNSLATLATFSLPPRQSLPSNLFQDFTGGGYFYLDDHDQVVTSTTTRHIYVISETPGAQPGFTLAHDYDLSNVLTASEAITSALPDQHGLLWVVSKTDGVVLTMNLHSGAIHSVKLGNGAIGEIENSFATDARGGVYIDTNRKLYRFVAGPGGTPKITWQVTYPNSGEHKPGQVDDGTGTTPLVMPGGRIAITDNADPMDVVVYRTAAKLKKGVTRRVCRVPVFTKGASATENSLIGAGRAMIVENNYGYQDPTSVGEGKLTSPGFTRVDVNRNGKGCHVVWTNKTERAPTVVPKVSLANGLIYTYTKDPGMSDPWYWTTLDFRTGRVVYKQFAGSSPSSFYNNNYAGIQLSPKGTEYLGTIGGLLALRDS